MNKELTGQKTRVLNHLQKKGPLTSMDAFQMYGITRLAAVVFDLRTLGYPIVTRDAFGMNRYGEQTHYASYALKGAQ